MKNIWCIIPTLNRHNDIINLAESFTNVKTCEDITLSIIVVDNSHDANAKEIVSNANFNFATTFLNETKKGLSNARNCGLQYLIKQTENIDYVITIDDDIIIPESFLHDLNNAINSHSEASIIGGRVELYNPEDLPITIKTDKEKQIYSGDQFFGFIFGCCLVIKYNLIKQVGKFDTHMGAGTRSPGSEDSDFIYRIWALHQGDVVYIPEYYVYHNHGRRDPNSFAQLAKNYAIGQGAFLTKHILFNKSKHVLKRTWWELNNDLKKTSPVFNNMPRKNKWYYRFLGSINYIKARITQ
ncbi:glycosyltransferase family 2 protein [Thalassotalea agariperforans]